MRTPGRAGKSFFPKHIQPQSGSRGQDFDNRVLYTRNGRILTKRHDPVPSRVTRG
jgi:hypothetical protein